MNKRVKLVIVAERIQKLASEMGGVFSYADLSNIIASATAITNSRVIKRLLNEGVLNKVQRGLYTTKVFDLWLLASRIDPNSYISMDSVLAKEGIIATIPARSLSVVRPAIRNKRIKTTNGDIIFHSVTENLFLGFECLRNGIKVATPEKAYLDMLYFYLKGRRFVVDPLAEVNLNKLDKGRIAKYLRKYKNPKFVRFVERLIYEK